MNSFSFRGPIPASKSLMNRALLARSFHSCLIIEGDSTCDDVRHMKIAIRNLKDRQAIQCGEAGTVFRFMGLRAARETGSFKLQGSSRLLQRPQQDLVHLLSQLSVKAELSAQELKITGEGWKKPAAPLKVDRKTSSQFASGLLLNSWNLPFDLEFEMDSGVSEGYWQMSLQMARELGMQIYQQGSLWTVPAGQKIKADCLRMEPDYSSAFAIAAAGALAGETVITNATVSSLQPDFRFIELMTKMGVEIQKNSNLMSIRGGRPLKALKADLADSPDLFPVLSVLCAFADGESLLGGAPHLVHKESNRIEKTAELLRLAGIPVTIQNDGMKIQGAGQQVQTRSFDFDTDEDHRMAMAAGLLKLKGFEIRIRHPEVVNKSYPEFWDVIGVKP